MTSDNVRQVGKRLDKSAFILTTIWLVLCTFTAFFPNVIFKNSEPGFSWVPLMVGCPPFAVVLWMEWVFKIPPFDKSN